jgi:hypothetical protein
LKKKSSRGSNSGNDNPPGLVSADDDEEGGIVDENEEGFFTKCRTMITDTTKQTVEYVIDKRAYFLFAGAAIGIFFAGDYASV